MYHRVNMPAQTLCYLTTTHTLFARTARDGIYNVVRPLEKVSSL